MRGRALALAVIATGTLVLTGCGGGDGTDDTKAELSVSGAYLPQPVSADMAAGFLTVTNKGGTADELTSVSSTAGQVSMHDTVGGAMTETDSLAVPAHGRLVFKSGGNHLMFEKLTHRLRQGDTVEVKLTFAESGPLTVEMPVKSATYNPTTGH